jgi:hypothetical protein
MWCRVIWLDRCNFALKMEICSVETLMTILDDVAESNTELSKSQRIKRYPDLAKSSCTFFNFHVSSKCEAPLCSACTSCGTRSTRINCLRVPLVRKDWLEIARWSLQLSCGRIKEITSWDVCGWTIDREGAQRDMDTAEPVSQGAATFFHLRQVY